MRLHGYARSVSERGRLPSIHKMQLSAFTGLFLMKRLFSDALGKFAMVLYGLGFAGLAGAHVYATILAYHYVYAWRTGRALLWVFLTFLLPVLSTIYWLVVHWLQTDIFWNGLTTSVAAGIGCIAAGTLCEIVKQLTSPADPSGP
jgi:hypothetical protein